MSLNNLQLTSSAGKTTALDSGILEALALVVWWEGWLAPSPLLNDNYDGRRQVGVLESVLALVSPLVLCPLVLTGPLQCESTTVPLTD